MKKSKKVVPNNEKMELDPRKQMIQYLYGPNVDYLPEPLKDDSVSVDETVNEDNAAETDEV